MQVNKYQVHRNGQVYTFATEDEAREFAHGIRPGTYPVVTVVDGQTREFATEALAAAHLFGDPNAQQQLMVLMQNTANGFAARELRAYYKMTDDQRRFVNPAF